MPGALFGLLHVLGEGKKRVARTWNQEPGTQMPLGLTRTQDNCLQAMCVHGANVSY